MNDAKRIIGWHRGRVFALVPLCVVILVAGCSQPPQMPKTSWKFIGSLRTAVAAKKKDWLEENAKLIDEQHRKNELTDEQYAEFQSIITPARDGDWEAAEKEAIRLEKAQRP